MTSIIHPVLTTAVGLILQAVMALGLCLVPLGAYHILLAQDVPAATAGEIVTLADVTPVREFSGVTGKIRASGATERTLVVKLYADGTVTSRLGDVDGPDDVRWEETPAGLRIWRTGYEGMPGHDDVRPVVDGKIQHAKFFWHEGELIPYKINYLRLEEVKK